MNTTTNQADLVDIYRSLNPTAEKYTFFSGVCGIFARIDHILAH